MGIYVFKHLGRGWGVGTGVKVGDFLVGLVILVILVVGLGVKSWYLTLGLLGLWIVEKALAKARR